MLECHASDNAGGKAGNRWGMALRCLVLVLSCMYTSTYLHVLRSCRGSITIIAIPYKSGVAVARLTNRLNQSISSPHPSGAVSPEMTAAAKNQTILAGVWMASRLGWVLVNARYC
jgi:hypothetical protein